MLPENAKMIPGQCKRVKRNFDMRISAFAAAVLALALTSGCEKATPAQTAATGTNQPVEQSGVSATIGTMLQYDTLKAGRTVQDRARKATAAHNERTREATSDDLK